MIKKRMTKLPAAYWSVALLLVLALTAGPVLAQGATPPVFREGWGSVGSGNLNLEYNHGIDVQHLAGDPYPKPRVYVADTNNHRIQIFDEDETGIYQYIQTLGASEELYFPFGVAVDSAGNVFVADTYDNQIVRYDADDWTYVEWGSRGSTLDPLRFMQPSDLALYESGEGNYLYVSDTFNNRVLKLGFDGALIQPFGGTEGKDFYRPTGIDVDSSGNVYVADSYNHRVVKISADGLSVTQFAGSTRGSEDGQFNMPNGIAVDSNGNVYVADSSNNRIQKFSSAGAYLTQWDTGNGPLNTPYGLAALDEDNVFVADSANHRVQVFEHNYMPEAITIDNNRVDESRLPGTLVGTLSTTDDNPGESQSMFTYQFVDGQDCEGNSSFRINGRNLETNVVLDYEVQSSYSVCIRSTDTGGLLVENRMTITVTNQSDPPVFNNATFAIDEHATATSGSQTNQVVGTLTASDNDADETVSFTIELGENSGAFKIGNRLSATSVELLVDDASLLNFETLTNHQVVLTITAADSSEVHLSDTATITVNLNDINDPPAITFNTEPYSIDENLSNVELPGYFTITDEDQLPTPDTITITEGFYNFNITYPSDVPNQGKFYVQYNRQMDYEAIETVDELGRPYRAGNIIINDGTTTTVIPAYRIYINNVDESPGWVTTCSVNENALAGTPVNCATDPEGEPLTYQIAVPITPAPFAVDAAGQLVVADPLLFDYEGAPTSHYYRVWLQVKDPTHDFSAASLKTIYINNLNEYKPELNVVPLSVNENSANGTVVGTVTVTDQDNWGMVYRTIDTNPISPFQINASTGVITVRNLYPYPGEPTRINEYLNYELHPTYNLTVRVDESGNKNITGDEMLDEETFVISLGNVNDPIRIIDKTTSTTDKQAFTTDEEVPPGTLIGMVEWQDDDVGTQPTFRKTGGDGINTFEINELTGAITVAPGARLDFETKSTYTLGISVTDNAVPTPVTDAGNITITVINTNDPPVFTDESFTLIENTANLTVVGDVAAVDSNGDNIQYSAVGGTGLNAFDINPASGVITVKDSTLLDYDTAAGNLLTLIVQATDDGDPAPASSTHTFNIHLTNVNERPVVVSDQSFHVAEDSIGGTVLGTVNAFDPEDGTDVLTFQEITGCGENCSGNAVFDIHPDTGVITVSANAPADSLDPVLHPVYKLTVTATNPGETDPAVRVSVATVLTINVYPEADPSVDVMVEPYKVLSGTNIPYQVTIKNTTSGPTDPVTLWLTLPNDFSFVSSPECHNSVLGEVECVVDTIPGDGSHVFEMVLNAGSGIGDGATVEIGAQLSTNSNNDVYKANNTKKDTFPVYKNHVIDFNFGSSTAEKTCATPIPAGWSAVTQSGTPIPTLPCEVIPNFASDPTKGAFLGKFVNNQANAVLTYQEANLPYHENLEVSFTLYVIKTWDGNGSPGPDIFKFLTNQADGSDITLLDTTFSNESNTDHYQSYPDNRPDGSHPAYTDSVSRNSLGFHVNDQPVDAVYQIKFNLAHTNRTLVLKFITENLQQALEDESWGIDNVHIVLTGSGDSKIFLPLLKR